MLLLLTTRVNAIFPKLSYKDSMVDGVESFFQIDENHTIYKAIVDNDRPNVIIKIITKLVVYNFFENFGNGWNNGFWSIIVRVVPFAFFENRSYSSEFPLSWKNTSVNRLH